jgi:SAM-dependent methyltransferase
MAHEVPDKPRFFREILSALKPGGALLLAEPKFHVWRKSFERTAVVCREQGFRILGEPAIPLSRAVLMGKEP